MAVVTALIGRDDMPKGLWRSVLGDETHSLRGVFRRLLAEADRFDVIADVAQGVFFARVELEPDEGSGSYRFLSIRDRIFCGITDCTYLDERVEEVRDEGFVELHFQLEGPADLHFDPEPSVRPGEDGAVHVVRESTMIACRNGADVSYAVRFPRGRCRLLGIYVDPELLYDSFEFRSETARRLIRPPGGEIPLEERSIGVDFVRQLQDLWNNPFSGRRDLMRAVARVSEIICLAVEALDAEVAAGAQSFSRRDIEMFERAREKLGTDFSKSYTTATLARELGTNATKLKSGFKFLYGTTIFEFRKALRMDYALQLLRRGDMTVAQISAAAGYTRQASFTSAFKAHFGFLPKAARQQGGETGPEG